MSDRTPEQRPRPRYGEYATPQEQAEIVAKSMPPVSPLLVPSDHAESVPVPTGAIEADAASAAPRRRWDLILSVALLLLGLWNVLGSFAQFSDVSSTIQQVFDMQGIGQYTPSPAAGAAGTVIIVANVALFAVATWLTVRRLMVGKLAFWIPLTAGVISFVVMMVAVFAVIASDPAWQSYLTDMQGSLG